MGQPMHQYKNRTYLLSKPKPDESMMALAKTVKKLLANSDIGDIEIYLITDDGEGES